MSTTLTIRTPHLSAWSSTAAYASCKAKWDAVVACGNSNKATIACSNGEAIISGCDAEMKQLGACMVGDGGVGGAGGAPSCTPIDPTDSCDICLNAKCCAEKTACVNDQGNPLQWTSKCAELWDQAVTCATAAGSTKTFSECLADVNTDFNPLANELHDCVYVSGCKTECQ